MVHYNLQKTKFYSNVSILLFLLTSELNTTIIFNVQTKRIAVEIKSTTNLILETRIHFDSTKISRQKDRNNDSTIDTSCHLHLKIQVTDFEASKIVTITLIFSFFKIFNLL